MTRSRLAAATAALTLALAACATDDDAGDDTATEETDGAATADGGDGASDAAGGDLTGTVADAQVADDGSVTLTVETDDGEQELTTSRAAYITAGEDGGAQQRQRLTSWLENNQFDGETTYTFEQFDGVVTDIHA